MRLRSGLFLAVTAIFANACTPSANPPPPISEATIAPPKPSAPIATTPEGGALPDFSSASNDPSDAGATPTAPAPDDDETVATQSPSPFLVPPNVDADDIREAVFRHMFGNNASGQQNGSGVFCLAVESDQDPTNGFLMRFRNVKTPVRPKSACDSSSRGVVDKKTGKHGLVFRVDHIRFKDAKHATVNGGYFEAGLSASGNVYTLEHKASGWVVTKDEMMWIS